MEQLKVLDLLEAVRVYERKIILSLTYSGLRLPQYKVIDFLEKSGKITVSDLSRHTNVTRATTSVLINELTKAGIVECIENSTDKRSFYIKLTERGKNKLKVARAEFSLVEEKISNELTQETIHCLNSFSQIIRD
jgi:DNA-binding MarR family transcriptional regulator